MKKVNWYRQYGMTTAIVMLCLAAASSHGAVTAEPASVIFTKPGQSFVIKLVNDGSPIPGRDIRGWQFLAGGHDYKHMVDVEKMNGAIKLSPSTTVELGSYDLNIETARGSVVVRVLTPFSEVPDIVEKMAAITEQSEQKVSEKLGLTSSSGRSDIELDLPPVYYEGQTLEMVMPSTADNGHTCMWFINGDAVSEGPDQYAFTYTFLDPGDYVLNYIEKSNDNGDPTVVAQARAYTRVVQLPAVSATVNLNTTVTYTAPAGYQKHSWSVDGLPVSGGDDFKHTFLTPGTHSIQCMASAPDQGAAKGFVRILYNTTVLPTHVARPLAPIE